MLCNEPHYINRCEQFINKTISERKEFLKSSNLRFNCLGKHQIKAYPSSYRCSVFRAKHHTLVHVDDYSHNQSINSSTTDQIASVTNPSSSNYGNIVISNDIESASQAVSHVISTFASRLQTMLKYSLHYHRKC